MATPKSKEYERGWLDAFDTIAHYVEDEVCTVTGSMIRRMKYEDWRFKEAAQSDTESSDTHPLEEQQEMMQFDPFDWEDHKHNRIQNMTDRLWRFLYCILGAVNAPNK